MADNNQWQWQESGSAWKGVGIYHVTLVVTSRQPLLGTLIIPDNNPQQARVERTEMGKDVIHALALIPKLHPEIRLLQYCLMPDHLHAVLYVTQPMTISIKAVVRGFWQGCKKVGRAYSASSESETVLSISPNIIRDNEQNPPSNKEQNPPSDSGAMNKDANIRDNEQNLPSKNEQNPPSDSGAMNKDADIRGNEQNPEPVFHEMPFIRPLSRRGQLDA